MPSLDEIMQARAERQAAQPQGGGINLFMRDDDIVIAHSLYSGADNDPYLEYYIAHDMPPTTQGGYRSTVYCPVQSGHNENYSCRMCKDDVKTKDRFAIWLYVYKILHKTIKAGEGLPKETWIDGREYFVRQLDTPKFWDTSAWRESPLDDIHMLAKQLGDLRKTRILLITSGTGMGKRYKFSAEMGTAAIDSAIYAAAVAEIKPVRQMLIESITSVPTVQANVTAAPPPNVTMMPPPNVTATAPLPTAPPADATLPPTLPPFKVPENTEQIF